MTFVPYTVLPLDTIATVDDLKLVKTECDKTHAGNKRNAALMHYEAAVSAHESKNNTECIRQLNAANHALAWYPFTS